MGVSTSGNWRCKVAPMVPAVKGSQLRGEHQLSRVKHKGDLMQWFSTQAQEPGCHHASSAAYSLHVTLPR